MSESNLEEEPQEQCKEAKFVDDYFAKLTERVTSVMPIADELKSKGMLHGEKYDEIKAEKTSQDKMRKLFESLNSGGDKVKKAFYYLLEKHQPQLFEDLGGVIRKRKLADSESPVPYKRLNIESNVQDKPNFNNIITSTQISAPTYSPSINIVNGRGPPYNMENIRKNIVEYKPPAPKREKKSPVPKVKEPPITKKEKKPPAPKTDKKPPTPKVKKPSAPKKEKKPPVLKEKKPPAPKKEKKPPVLKEKKPPVLKEKKPPAPKKEKKPPVLKEKKPPAPKKEKKPPVLKEKKPPVPKVKKPPAPKKEKKPPVLKEKKPPVPKIKKPPVPKVKKTPGPKVKKPPVPKVKKPPVPNVKKDKKPSGRK
ncbi:uncharacterized protein LOC143731254 [Siphateles boraxobius]|uniref:uncharacterized protein LOC143731254 n=1 Tax=Siphateles boraxobius TaxID=180520 RepID=UPI00406335A2